MLIWSSALTLSSFWSGGTLLAQDRAAELARPEPARDIQLPADVKPPYDRDILPVQDAKQGAPAVLPTLPETRIEGARPQPQSASPQQQSTPLAFPANTSLATPVPFGNSPAGTLGLGSNLLGQTSSASAGRISQSDLQYRRFSRTGEIMEVVPGLIVTPHSGGGKASQWALRGAYMDHGTDFSLFVDGMPVNLRTHAHGQGYLDINWIIPELIEGIEYRKGPYYADVGDFSAVGTSAMRMASKLTDGFAKIETGSYAYNRFVTGKSLKVGQGDLLYGVEARYADTAWEAHEKLQRFSGILKYTMGNEDAGFSVSGMSYYSQWTSTDQVPELAITSGLIDRFGYLDPTTGGNTYRHSANSEFWAKLTDNSITRAQVYGIWYNLDLYSSLDGPDSQIQQFERRFYYGSNASHQITTDWFCRKQIHTFGLNFRDDSIPNIRLANSAARVVTEDITSDAVRETNLSFFNIESFQLTDRLRAESGIRWDHYWFDVNSRLTPANTGNQYDDIWSPKANLIYRATEKMELFLNGGFGFHSNDARGVIQVVDPSTGERITQATPPLVRGRGAEAGVRTSGIIPGLVSTAAVFYLDLDQELIFSGDAGTTEPNGKTRRVGVELVNFYNITDWWSCDVSFTGTSVRFDQPDPDTGGRFVPNTLPFTVSGGTQFKAPSGWFGSLRCRSFFAGPLTSDNNFRSEQTILFNAILGYQRNRWTVGIEGINILNAQAPDVSYAYPFTLAAGGPEFFGRVIRPTDPIQARVFFSITY